MGFCNLNFAIFLDEDAEVGKIRRNEFRRKGIFYPSEEIHLAGWSHSLQVSSKILQSRGNVLLEADDSIPSATVYEVKGQVGAFAAVP